MVKVNSSMSNNSINARLKTYLINNEGDLYKSIAIIINNMKYNYNIYWGDPKIIFDEKVIKKELPLAITIISHIKSIPKSCIYLHKQFDEKYKSIFEMVVIHEIGHLWLHDIVGFNNPCTYHYMEENESENWSNYFSYKYFAKYKNMNHINEFFNLLKSANNIQMEIYNIENKGYFHSILVRKIDYFKKFTENINIKINEEDRFIKHMNNAIEITLIALGNIFK